MYQKQTLKTLNFVLKIGQLIVKTKEISERGVADYKSPLQSRVGRLSGFSFAGQVPPDRVIINYHHQIGYAYQ